MNVRRIVPILATIALLVGGCASNETEVTAQVGPHFSHEGLNPGDPLVGGSLLLYDGDEIMFETVLDNEGKAAIEPDPGEYDIQIRLDSAEDPLCFWGTTEFGVEFPSSPIELEVGFICAGS